MLIGNWRLCSPCTFDSVYKSYVFIRALQEPPVAAGCPIMHYFVQHNCLYCPFIIPKVPLCLYFILWSWAVIILIFQEESLEIVAWSSCTFIIKGGVTISPTNETTLDVQRSWETFDTLFTCRKPNVSGWFNSHNDKNWRIKCVILLFSWRTLDIFGRKIY